jgi:hypothetical protein
MYSFYSENLEIKGHFGDLGKKWSKGVGCELTWLRIGTCGRLL